MGVVGDPGLGIDGAVFDEGDDAGEVAGEGVAGGEDGEFAAVDDGGVWESDFLLGDADVDDFGTEGAEAWGGGHGEVIAGGIDDDIGELAIGDGGEVLEFGAIGFGVEEVLDAEGIFAEVEASGVGIEDDGGSAGEFDEFEGGEADGAGADDEDVVGGGDLGAIDGVTADGEGFDEGELIVGEGGGGVEFASGEEEEFGEAAVAHYAEGLVRFAAIGEAASAGVAGLAIDVRLDGAVHSGGDVGDMGADGEDFDAEFVAGDAGVGEEGHFAEVPCVIGATDADAVDANEGLVGGGWRGGGEGEGAEGERGVERDGFHGRRERELVLAIEEMGGEGGESGGIFFEREEGGVGEFGEASGFGAGAIEAEDGGVSGFAGGEIFAGGFAELGGGLGEVEEIVDDLESEAEGVAESGEGLEFGWGDIGGHGAEADTGGEEGGGFGVVDVAEFGRGDGEAFGLEISDLATDEGLAPAGGGEFADEGGDGVARGGG